MLNYEIEATWHYHNGTKHPNGMLLNRFHVYHPSHRPTPYKIYNNVSQIDLPFDKTTIGISALDAISTDGNIHNDAIPDIRTLGRILYFSSGITKKIKFQGLGEMDFRAASCTGALYHIEIYLVCSDLPGLRAGVYHFDPKHMKLDTIRLGDFRKFISCATAEELSVTKSPAILIFTDVFSRNSIKYQSREYRHAFWDCGTILANTLAITSAHKIPTKVITGFVDSSISKLLGLDTNQEAPIVIVPLGETSQEAPDLSPLQETNPDAIASDYEIEYPEVNAMHESSSLLTEVEASSWRRQITTERKDPTTNLIPLGKNIKVQEPLENTIIRRGSTRKFSLEPITFDQLSTILNQTTSGMNSDFANHELLSDVYIIANAVDGLESGSYHFVKEKNSLEQLRKGNFRHVSGNLGLDQDLPYDASVTIFFMINLDKILEHFGNRGYRVAQLDAAISGGRMYLASYALGLGATGLTFYDDLVTNFFSPHAENKETMFLIAIGKKEKTT